jgi:dethiobiotin synthetase
VPRPETLVAVAGTGTEVGKTWVAARVITRLRERGVRVAARKPAQSFAPGDGDATDAELLAEASGETAEAVCPRHRWYEVPMAPPMAADALGRPPFTIDDLVREITWSWPDPSPAVGLVELAGGPASPIALDGDGADLVHRLAPDHTLLVADAGLGTINAVRLSASVLTGRLTVVLNRFDPTDDLHRRNAQWLTTAGFTVATEIEDVLASLVPRQRT